MSRQRVVSESSRTSTKTRDGRSIIAREYNAQAPHPAPSQAGRLVASKGINKLLVDPGAAGTDDERETGVELYECDPCGWTAENAISVRAHLASHNPARTEPDYDVRTMRLLVATVTKYKKSGRRNYAELAAAELNTLGVKPRSRDRWLAQNVSRLFRDWKDRPEVKRARAARTTLSDISEERVTVPLKSGETRSTPSHVSPLPDHPLVGKLSQLATEISRAASSLADLVDEVADMPLTGDVLTPGELEALRAKAAKYDVIAGALRDTGDPTE